jgi:hypothetical protein
MFVSVDTATTLQTACRFDVSIAEEIKTNLIAHVMVSDGQRSHIEFIPTRKSSYFLSILVKVYVG